LAQPDNPLRPKHGWQVAEQLGQAPGADYRDP
jgi:hypothetical protein